jgi:hypothetical protein
LFILFRTIAINFAVASQLISEFSLFHHALTLANVGLELYPKKKA